MRISVVVFVLACILYFICVRLRILGIFRNYTNFYTHTRTYRTKWYVLLAVMRNVLCLVFVFLFFCSLHIALFCLDRGHQLRKGTQQPRSKMLCLKKPKNFIKCICLHKHHPNSKETETKTENNKNNNCLQTNITIYDISSSVKLPKNKIKYDKDFHPN